MYCRHCGNEIQNGAECCLKCGYKNGDGNEYCPNCGEKVDANAAICVKCGHSLEKKTAKKGTKSKMTAGLLGIFLGGFGVHNFYLGFTGKGIAQIFLSFCFGIGAIWGLIEGICILTGSINKDAKGDPLLD